MSSPRWRLFVAVPIDERLRRQLASAVDRWSARPDCAELRWTDAAGWHLTLAFLGATDPEQVPRIQDAMEYAARGMDGFTLATGGVGAFPSRARARVAWYGVDDPERRLASLAAGVRRELSLEAQARSYRPHLTLARVRGSGFAATDLRRWTDEADPPNGQIVVDGIHLMRSHLGRGLARYESLARVPLEAAVHV